MFFSIKKQWSGLRSSVTVWFAFFPSLHLLSLKAYNLSKSISYRLSEPWARLFLGLKYLVVSLPFRKWKMLEMAAELYAVGGFTGMT